MANFSAIVPVELMDAANAELEAEHGPGNFSRATATGSTGSATHALLHCWDIPAFRQAVQALIDSGNYPGLKIRDGNGEPNADEMLTAEGMQWVQPEGSHDTYMKGDQVTVDGKTWESLIDYNVWPPGVSGWREVVQQGYPAWVQPTGAHDAYPLGARVTHNGSDWENTGSAANVWEPGVFGWTRI